MDSLKNKLQDYLKAVSGEAPVLTKQQDAGLPLYLRERYALFESRIFGQKHLLALSRFNEESPGEYQADASRLRGILDTSAILVIESLSSYDRNFLVKRGVPFIVPGSQTFIPLVFIDLREKQPLPKESKVKKLTPAAQCVILQHLQKSNLDRISMKYLASKVGYTSMMMSKVKTQLVNAGLAETERVGKTVLLRFTSEGEHLWEKALPFLRTPVRKTYWIQWNSPDYPALLAGTSALSRESILADDALPTYALWYKTFQKNLEQGLFHGCRCAEDADIKMESWSYNPLTTSDNADVVDKLSLYLSLRDNPDDRIQQQLEHLIHKASW